MSKRRSSFPFLAQIALSMAMLMVFFMGFALYKMYFDDTNDLTVHSLDAEKFYDGKPLTNPSWEILSGQLKDGHVLLVNVSGSQTEVGSSNNTLSVRIEDQSGNDVSDEYDISLAPGILTVHASLGDLAGSHGAGSGSTGSGEGTQKEYFSVHAPRTGYAYLRHKSYGHFTGVKWNERISSYGKTPNPLTYIGSAMEKLSYPMEEMLIRTKQEKMLTPYHFINTNEICDSDDRIVPYSKDEYLVNYFYQHDVTALRSLMQTDSKIIKEEKAYRTFVYDQYLRLDEVERSTLLTIAEQAGIYKNNDDVIEQVARFMQEFGTYNLEFKDYPDDVNHVLHFMQVAKEGVCVQYASAATLMFRALGIPARYVTGYLVYTQEDTWVEVDATVGHAWTEVYVDGLGWIPVEVTPADGTQHATSGSGDRVDDPDDGKTPVRIKPTYVSCEYDGNVVYAPKTVTGFENWEKKGYYYEATISGSQREYGYAVSLIEEFFIYDSKHRNVTDQFKIITSPGEIHVYFSELVSKSDDLTKIYDGMQIDVSDITFSGRLMYNHILQVRSTANAGVGNHVNSYEVYVTDPAGKDVSYYYEIKSYFGSLTVTPLALSLKAGDGKKNYDGKELVSQSYSIESGQLLEGHTITSCTFAGSQTEVGRSENLITEIIIKDEKGNDVTGNYAITLLPGKLEVVGQ